MIYGTADDRRLYRYLKDELGVDVLDYMVFDVEEMSVDGDTSDGAVNEFMLEYLWNSKKGDKRLVCPAEVYSDCPHAEYIEFGTGPAKKSTLKDQDSSLFEVIHDWAEDKLGDKFKTPDQLERFVKRITAKIIQDGIAPQPYFRAAVYQTMDEDLQDKEYREGEITLYDVAEMIDGHIKDNLTDNDTDYKGALRASIHVEYRDDATLSGGEIRVPDTGATEIGEGVSTSDSMWTRDNARLGVPDRNGAPKKARRKF